MSNPKTSIPDHRMSNFQNVLCMYCEYKLESNYLGLKVYNMISIITHITNSSYRILECKGLGMRQSTIWEFVVS